MLVSLLKVDFLRISDIWALFPQKVNEGMSVFSDYLRLFVAIRHWSEQS